MIIWTECLLWKKYLDDGFWPGAAVPNNRRKRTMGKMGGLMQVRFEARRLMSAPGHEETLRWQGIFSMGRPVQTQQPTFLAEYAMTLDRPKQNSLFEITGRWSLQRGGCPRAQLLGGSVN